MHACAAPRLPHHKELRVHVPLAAQIFDVDLELPSHGAINKSVVKAPLARSSETQCLSLGCEISSVAVHERRRHTNLAHGEATARHELSHIWRRAVLSRDYGPGSHCSVKKETQRIYVEIIGNFPDFGT